jgi:diguanylate cyclase (GGDEF)-like protein/PAS domain S-box-containing protein
MTPEERPRFGSVRAIGGESIQQNHGADGGSLGALFDSVADVILGLNSDGHCAYVSPAILYALGYEPGPLIGKHIVALVHPDEASAVARLIHDTCTNDGFTAVTLRFRHRDGTWRAMDCTINTYAGVDGERRLAVVARDVTERSQAFEEVARRERHYRELVENANDIVYVHDLEGNFTEVNAAASRVFGYKNEEFLRLNVGDILDPLSLAVARETTAARIRGEERSEPYELLTRTKDGDAVWLEVSARILKRDGQPYAVEGIARDITRRKQAEERLLEQSRHDAVTGVLNHRAANDAVHELTERGERCALVICDVNGMKAINDGYGHEVGDRALSTIARALEFDGAIVGRYGGDEFVAILPGADRDRAEAYQERLATTIAEANLNDPATGVRIPLSASIGLAVFPDEAQHAGELIKLADSAMYASRRHRDTTTSAVGEVLSSERAAQLVGDLVPLLTAAGTREEKLGLVANKISVGAGYDAVNFEVSGEKPATPQEWEGAYVRAPEQLIEAWMEAQNQATDHPLGKLLDRTRKPVFMDRIATAEELTPEERTLISAAGLKSALVVPMIWQDRLVGMLSVASKREAAFTAWDAQFLTAVSSQVTAIVWMTTLVEELQLAQKHLSKAHADTVMLLANAAEAHDDTTGRHIQRVRSISEAIARELGYNEAQSHEIGLAAVLHDVGKFYVPDSILRKPAKLTDDEWVVMRQHTIWGAQFLEGKYGFELAATIAKTHHESWDGSGYPQGLKEEEIPEATLITSVADAFDAMTNDRPYRLGRPAQEAIEELERFAGRQFSPRVVEAMVRLYERGALPVAGGGRKAA